MASLVELCLLVLCSVYYPSLASVKKFDTVTIEECVPGKYFWRESNPQEFYACLTLSKRAVKMRCSVKTYMCNTGPEVFQPCMCKGSPAPQSDNSLLDDHDNQLQQGDSGGELRAATFSRFAKMAPADSDEDAADTRNMAETVDTMLGSAQRSQSDPSNTWESLPAGGCPDPFKKYDNAHMIGGYVQQYTDLISCQRACTETRGCIGIDWNREADTSNHERCYFVFPESTQTQKNRMHDTCCDHYRRTLCKTEVVTRSPGTDKSGFVDKASSYYYSDKENSVMIGDGAGTPSRTGNDDEMNDVEVADDDDNDDDIVTTPNPNTETSTIPDSGCPYTFQKFPGMSHPFGRNVTAGPDVDEMEECKYWCLIRSYCQGVDFDQNTNTCYFLIQVEPGLVTQATGVTHFRKIECTRPLRCYTLSTEVLEPEDLSVTDSSTPQTQCNGVCYTRETAGTDSNTVERGCMTSSVPVALGCQLSDSLLTVTCFCDTSRCNGLSVYAQATQYLHLPLDSDFSDHSGFNNQATVAEGYTAPNFQCLDKSVNCSALFTGSQCIQVNSAQDLGMNLQNNAGDLPLSPEATFSVHFKRITSQGDSFDGGIFGNSPYPDVEPTWRIASKAMDGYISGGLTSEETVMPGLDDYNFKVAANDEWHVAVMTYQGAFDPPNGQFSSVKLFIDGEEQTGNSDLDQGRININTIPISVGCVQNNPFFGYIDEARIFVTELSREDVIALSVMRDDNYWY